MISQFIDGLVHYHFLQNALITAVAIGVVAGVIGCFIILRGMSLMGDAISHAVLPGCSIILYFRGEHFLLEQFSLVFLHRSLSPIFLTIV